MAGAHQIRACGFPAAGEISELLLLDGRNAHERQLPGEQGAHQPLSVAPVGFDPLAGLARDRTRRAHPHLDPPRRRLARQPIADRSGLIGRHHRARQLLQVVDRRPRRTVDPAKPQLSGVQLKSRRDRRFRMHIETDQRPMVMHVGTSHDWGVRRRPIPPAQSPHTRARGADLYRSARTSRSIRSCLD